MKIDERIINYEINKQLSESGIKGVQNTDGRQLPNEKKIEGSGQAKQADVVSLSQASTESRKIKDIIESAPDVREERVAGIKESIESGKYNVDNDLVADKLVKSILEEIF